MPKYDILSRENYPLLSTVSIIGAVVARGESWKWGHQDFGGSPSMQGKITSAPTETSVIVKWNSGKRCEYRWGVNDPASTDGKKFYDLDILSLPGDALDANAAAPEVIKPVKTEATTAAAQVAIMKLFADTLAEKFADAPAVSEAVIERMVADQVNGQLKRIKPVVIKVGDAPAKLLEGNIHESFASLLRIVSCNLPVMMIGPAGSGKTTTAHQVADQLGLDFTTQSVCSQTTASTLLGYMDANGRYVPSLFRKVYENGGVYLLDEIDAGNPNVLAVLNSALSNGSCAFPDQMVPRHENFRCIAAANTWGTGRTIEYVGRQALDAATLDRFVQIEWSYDEVLERQIAGNDEWVTFVQSVRRAVVEKQIKHLVTPRSSIFGAKLLAAGMPRKQVEKLTIFKGLDPETAGALSSAARA